MTRALFSSSCSKVGFRDFARLNSAILKTSDLPIQTKHHTLVEEIRRNHSEEINSMKSSHELQLQIIRANEETLSKEVRKVEELTKRVEELQQQNLKSSRAKEEYNERHQVLGNKYAESLEKLQEHQEEIANLTATIDMRGIEVRKLSEELEQMKQLRIQELIEVASQQESVPIHVNSSHSQVLNNNSVADYHGWDAITKLKEFRMAMFGDADIWLDEEKEKEKEKEEEEEEEEEDAVTAVAVTTEIASSNIQYK
ncbi:hypothetical protein EDC94DRAFT_659204 [Helicostylum pulchrum]|nr:hypothetical protein EDC94DRAFT_659204 [Helicostylum pulchrum]